MDANALSGDAESADLVDLSKVDSSDKGKKRSSTTEFEPSADNVDLLYALLPWHCVWFAFLLVTVMAACVMYASHI